MAFARYFSEEDIEALKQEPLFTQFLMPDIVRKQDVKKVVFPAVRQGRIDFYHRGGKVFSYSRRGGFSTHQKYASVLPCSQKKHYVTEADLQAIPRIKSFTDQIEGERESLVYERIKENCALYAGDEAESVSRLYNRYSCAKKKQEHEIVVLDIEVSFRNLNDDRPDGDRKRSRQDRIDLLLFNTRTGKLRFFEAKLYTNGEVRAETRSKPPVLKQMKRYREQLGTEKQREQILTQYKNHVSVMNCLFETDLPTPTSIDPEPGLYVFGFDKDQKLGRLKRNLDTLYAAGIRVYAKGDPKNVGIHTLWEEAKAR